MTWNEIVEIAQGLETIQIIYIVGALLVLFFAVVLLLRRQPKKVVAYTTENGRVMVNRSAIVELVQTSCKQLANVCKPSVRIKAKGRYTHLEIRLKLLSGGKLKQVEETLQNHLRNALSEDLGIENLGKINIIATGFKSGKIEQPSILPNVQKPEPEEDRFIDETDDDPEFIDENALDPEKK